MNFKHLHYFWATARAGGVLRAGEQLHTTPQTISAQIKLLEDRLGRSLFKKRGRQLELTDEGRLAADYADQIFALGAELEVAMQRARSTERSLEFRVGVSDSVPKSVARRLLEPAWSAAERVRLVCHEGKLRDLLGQLAVHRLDLVLADEPLPRSLSVKAFQHRLGSTGLAFFASAALRKTLPPGRFPQTLHGAPMLLPGRASPIRPRLEQWFADQGIAPEVVGEFDDGALTKAFGQAGRGVFVAPSVLERETCAQYSVSVLGRSETLVEEFHAISAERRITHPCVAAITEAARDHLFKP